MVSFFLFTCFAVSMTERYFAGQSAKGGPPFPVYALPRFRVQRLSEEQPGRKKETPKKSSRNKRIDPGNHPQPGQKTRKTHSIGRFLPTIGKERIKRQKNKKTVRRRPAEKKRRETPHRVFQTRFPRSKDGKPPGSALPASDFSPIGCFPYRKKPDQQMSGLWGLYYKKEVDYRREHKAINKNKAPNATCASGLSTGLPDRIRTCDLKSRSLARYPAVPRVDDIGSFRLFYCSKFFSGSQSLSEKKLKF